MQFRGNPLLVPVSRIARQNPVPLTPLTPVTPALMRPNPVRRVHRNPFALSPSVKTCGAIALGSTGAVAIDRLASSWAAPDWTRAAACAGSLFLGNSRMAASFGGAMFFSLFSNIYYRSVARGIVAGASAATNA